MSIKDKYIIYFYFNQKVCVIIKETKCWRQKERFTINKTDKKINTFKDIYLDRI